MAQLVLLTMLIQKPFAEEARERAAYCNMAIESFEWMMPLHAANKARTMSQTFVDEWKQKTDLGLNSHTDGASNKRRRSTYNPELNARVRGPKQLPRSNPSSPQVHYSLQAPQNTFASPFVQGAEFQTPIHFSPQASDSSFSPLNPTRYEFQPVPYSTTQTLDAAAAETLQSFSGPTSWGIQGISMGDGAMGWTYNFEDLFGDMPRNGMGQGGM
jgi:hypothetical protein